MSTASTRPDINAFSAYAQENARLDGLNLSEYDGREYSDALKISHCKHISGTNLVVPQGLEDAVDVTASEDVRLHGDFGTSGATFSEQVVTIKGGCKDVTLFGRLLTQGTKSRATVQIGNWFDQSYGITRGVTLNLSRPDGKPILVAIGWAVPFSTRLMGDCRYSVWESLKLKAYVAAKFIVRMALRIPQGQKGPAWM